MWRNCPSRTADALPNGRQALGGYGESLAARWYLDRGYEVVDRNWRAAGGEIDLILRQGRVLVFCEVKTRASDRYGSPAEAVTAVKQRRIRRVAAAYLQGRHGPGRPDVLRFDVACVTGRDVEVIEQAF
ncbi:MAG: YraN family protein [Acidimicrobiales bacterium]|jgi:putative endonuclease